MDPVTQAAMGGVMGELVLGRKLGWRAIALGCLFGTLPDLDIFFLPFAEQAQQLRIHRGFSHSILAMVSFAFIFCKPLSLACRKQGVTTARAWWFVFLAWSTHVMVDVFTSYGTQVFGPFSDTMVATSNLFIIDPFFTLPMIIGLVLVCLKQPGSPERQRIMRRALLISSLYVAFSFTIKLWATNRMKAKMIEELPEAEFISATPTPFNTLLWRGLIETEDAYWVTYWSPFDDRDSKLEFLPKNRDLLKVFQGEELYETLDWFAQGHWVARKLEDGKRVLVAVRFGEMRDLEEKEICSRFQWHLYFDEAGMMRAPRYAKQVDAKPMLGLLFERMWGRQDRWEEMKEF